jgi:DNA-binding MarR family transcriptional regulator
LLWKDYVAARTHSPVSPARRQLLKALDEAGRRIGAQTVLVSDLVATRVGLNSTDLECLDLLYLAGPTTAGRLAAHTGLTSGATTAAIDRLEDAGFVTRRRVLDDRRVVLVNVVDAGAKLIQPFYRPLLSRLDAVHARYPDRQLKTVLRFLTDAFDATAEHVAWLQTQPVVLRRRCRHPVIAVASPVATRRQGRGARSARERSR